MRELDELYRLAARATAKGSKSFYYAARFFPPYMAKGAHAVYWFCRYTDDLVDECQSLEQGARDLEAWSEALRRAWDGRTRSDHDVLAVFLHAARQFGIPREYPFELIEGMRMDLNRTRYRTFDELKVFCYRVASIVGLMMCHVIGFENREDRDRALPCAIDLGIAMQLTNILRDVREDLERGRIYLPSEEMEAFGCTEADLLERRRTSSWCELIRFEAARARNYYQKGNAGIALLSADGRFAVKTASDVYREILRVIETPGFDVFARRAVVPPIRKHWLTARNLGAPVLRRSAEKVLFWRNDARAGAV